MPLVSSPESSHSLYPPSHVSQVYIINSHMFLKRGPQVDKRIFYHKLSHHMIFTYLSHMRDVFIPYAGLRVSFICIVMGQGNPTQRPE